MFLSLSVNDLFDFCHHRSFVLHEVEKRKCTIVSRRLEEKSEKLFINSGEDRLGYCFQYFQPFLSEILVELLKTDLNHHEAELLHEELGDLVAHSKHFLVLRTVCRIEKEPVTNDIVLTAYH